MNTKNFKSMMVLGALVLLFGASGSGASAQTFKRSPAMEAARLGMEAQQAWWNSLTPRERQLVRAVSQVEEAYRQETGNQYIPVNPQNLRVMMRRIGAGEHEAGFVLNQMRATVQFYDNLQRVDRQIDYMQKNPYWYLPPHMRPR